MENVHRKLQLLRTLAEGCRKHPAYRARRTATGRCKECAVVWKARQELEEHHENNPWEDWSDHGGKG